MWDDLVKQKEKWIGGKLIDYGDPFARAICKEGMFPAETIIEDITVSDTHVNIVGQEFDCGGAREAVVVKPRPEFPLPEHGLAFKGYGRHEFHIVKPDERKETEI